jgi:hypothetical protein
VKRFVVVFTVVVEANDDHEASNEAKQAIDNDGFEPSSVIVIEEQ